MVPAAYFIFLNSTLHESEFKMSQLSQLSYTGPQCSPSVHPLSVRPLPLNQFSFNWLPLVNGRSKQQVGGSSEMSGMTKLGLSPLIDTRVDQKKKDKTFKAADAGKESRRRRQKGENMLKTCNLEKTVFHLESIQHTLASLIISAFMSSGPGYSHNNLTQGLGLGFGS